MILAQTLRDAILQAAIQGKLTEHYPTDGDIDNLISSIKSDKIQLLSKKQARADKDYAPIDSDEILFDIPTYWKWMRLGEIGVYKKGPFGSSLTKSMFVPKSDTAVKVYEQKNAIQKDSHIGTYYITKEYYNKVMKGFTVEPGDIIVSCAGTIGETFVLPPNSEIGIINQALMRMNISEHINTDYFLIYFDHVLKLNAQRSSQGTAIKNIPAFEVLKKMLIPIPPIEEQQRIVDRVNELLAKVDEFEKIENRLTVVKEKFPSDLRAAILQAAMQGKLTEQLDTDSSVDELLSRIEIEKKQSNKKGNSPRINPILDEEIPYDIPSSWRWVRFGNLVDFSMGKTPARGESAYWDADYPWVSISDMPENGIVDSTAEKISYFAFNSVFKGNFSPAGTLLMSFKLTVGRVSYLGIDAVHNEAIISIFPLCDIEDTIKRYLFKILPFISKYGDTKDAIKGKTLNKASIANLLIPLPPIEEQQRIVERLDALLPLCDELTEE